MKFRRLSKKSIVNSLILGIFFIIFSTISFFGSKFETPFEFKKNDFGFEDINGEIYFSPINFKIYESFFENVKNNLFIQIYTLTYNDFIKIIKKLADKGVETKIIAESKKYAEFGGDFEKLKKNLENYNVKFTDDGGLGTNYVHSKFLLFDGKFLIQTANLTYSSFNKNRELFFYSDNQKIYENLEYIFLSDFNKQKIEKQKIVKNLLVCNIDCREKLEKILISAKKSIYIENQYISDKNIINILKLKQNIDIKILLSENAKSQDYDSLKDFVKIYKKNYLHAKVIIVDNKYLIISSINLSTNSIDNNREIGIVLINQKLIDKYLKNFNKIWDEL